MNGHLNVKKEAFILAHTLDLFCFLFRLKKRNSLEAGSLYCQAQA